MSRRLPRRIAGTESQPNATAAPRHGRLRLDVRHTNRKSESWVAENDGPFRRKICGDYEELRRMSTIIPEQDAEII